MNSDSEIPGCVHAGRIAHKWWQADVGRLDARGVRALRIQAQERGRELVAGLKVGTWVAVEAAMDAKDPYWVGQVLDVGDGSPVVKRAGGRETINKTAFSEGDMAIAVQWFHRDDGDSERRTFIVDPPHSDPLQVDVFNSSELRCIDLVMEKVPAPLRFTPPRRRSARASAVAARVAPLEPIDAPHTISCAQERRVLASLTGA